MNKPNNKLRDIVIKILEDNKALDVTTLDVFNRSTICDYIIISTGTSSKHIHSIGDNLVFELKKHDMPNLSIEGSAQASWILVDIGDIIVHIFQKEMRELFNLEELWDRPKNLQ